MANNECTRCGGPDQQGHKSGMCEYCRDSLALLGDAKKAETTAKLAFELSLEWMDG